MDKINLLQKIINKSGGQALGGAPVAHDLAHALDGVGDVLDYQI